MKPYANVLVASAALVLAGCFNSQGAPDEDDAGTRGGDADIGGEDASGGGGRCEPRCEETRWEQCERYADEGGEPGDACRDDSFGGAGGSSAVCRGSDRRAAKRRTGHNRVP